MLNAIRAHHGEEPARYPETFLVTAADAISGARPGARRESFEHYVKRLEKLEEIASSWDGVEKVYAIQAGREIRIMVTPDKVSDEEMARLSERTARRIENELQYPGQIKVVVGARVANRGLRALTRADNRLTTSQQRREWMTGAAHRREADRGRDPGGSGGTDAGPFGAGIRPGLGVVLVGDDPASHVYVRMKTRACNEAGIYARDITPPADVGRAELLRIVDELNADPAIHGILVQLPLPRHLDEREVTERIDPAKDVDGFHP